MFMQILFTYVKFTITNCFKTHLIFKAQQHWLQLIHSQNVHLHLDLLL